MTTSWIVGLDLGRMGDGALVFAKWFTGAGGAIGVHVLEEEHLLYVLRDHHLDEVVKAATDAVGARVNGAGASAVFRDLKVVQAVHAEEALEEARGAVGAEGLIVGRATSGGVHLFRLGRVVRRLLRTLASPVVVVPPDLESVPAGDGPVIALTNCQEDALGGCAFAAEVAKRMGRRWVVLHVARAIEAEYLPLASRTRAQEATLQAAQERVEAWVRAHDLSPDRILAEPGSPVSVACEAALRERAPLLVTGSRRLSTGERALQTSFGSALASASPVAVAVVPPPSARAS